MLNVRHSNIVSHCPVHVLRWVCEILWISGSAKMSRALTLMARHLALLWPVKISHAHQNQWQTGTGFRLVVPTNDKYVRVIMT
jgi:hypothetical protein